MIRISQFLNEKIELPEYYNEKTNTYGMHPKELLKYTDLNHKYTNIFHTNSKLHTKYFHDIWSGEKKDFDHHQKIKDVNKQSFRNYTGSGYVNINNYLRNGTDFDGNHKYIGASHIKKMDEAFNHPDNKIPHNVHVYRSVNSEILKPLKKGDTFHDKGYVSTSLVRPNAHISTQVHIHIPSGSKALHIHNYSDHIFEHELLIHRGSNFKYLGKTKLHNNLNNWMHHLELLPHEDNK